jgi:hypothetical protein
MIMPDQTKELLEHLLASLYQQQATRNRLGQNSYLIAQDGQYLGTITKNHCDQNSILNKYSPYGSRYSNTSIFNPYSPYGSRYGNQSINNPYCSMPPKLVINGKLLGRVTENTSVPNRIATEAFLYTLQNEIDLLLQGKICESEKDIRCLKKESFIIAQDGQFLGSIKPDTYDQDSIFNNYSPYGSSYSQFSIYNTYSKYGNIFSQYSPYNQFSQTPPEVYVNGKFVAYLTINQLKTPRLAPEELKEWAKDNVSH